MSQRSKRGAAPCSALVVALAVAAATPAAARITRLDVLRVEPAFGGAIFGAVGAYERVIGRAHGEVDPRAPGNAVIQDIDLAPRDERGLVAYDTDVEILRPADPARGDRVLLFNVLNRGNKGALALFNADVPPGVGVTNRLESAGDGFLQRQGTTLVWFGWQADVLPGNNRMTIAGAGGARIPMARPITGHGARRVRGDRHATPPTQNLSSSGWFTAMATAGIPIRASAPTTRPPQPDGFVPDADQCAPRENAPRRSPFPNSGMELRRPAAPTGSSSRIAKAICLPAGFQTGPAFTN